MAAALDPTDVIQLQATGSLIRDNNLFRLPDVDPRLFGIDPANKADTTLVKGIGLKVDKLLSRQRLIADMTINESTYDRNTNLDFVGGDGRLAWLWQVGNYWSGEARYRKRRSLAGFTDFRQNIQDLVDTDTYFASAGHQFHPRLRISADLTEEDTDHSEASRRSLNFSGHTVGAELTYSTPAQNSVSLRVSRADRNYPNRVNVGLLTFDNGHTESRVNAIAVWQFTGALKLNAQLGSVHVEHDQLSQRDFSGATWRAGATWDATAKFRLAFNTIKDVRLYEDLATNYIVLKSAGLSPTYAITPKIVIQGNLNFEKRAYRGDPGFVIANIDREDTIRLGRIGVSYSPIRNINLALTYETGDRRTNGSFLNNFDYQTWFGTLQVGF